MSVRDWKALVERYADGRRLCNCGDAYYTAARDAGGEAAHGAFYCASGCSANLIRTKYEIAARVRRELGEPQAG